MPFKGFLITKYCVCICYHLVFTNAFESNTSMIKVCILCVAFEMSLYNFQVGLSSVTSFLRIVFIKVFALVFKVAVNDVQQAKATS